MKMGRFLLGESWLRRVGAPYDTGRLDVLVPVRQQLFELFWLGGGEIVDFSGIFDQIEQFPAVRVVVPVGPPAVRLLDVDNLPLPLFQSRLSVKLPSDRFVGTPDSELLGTVRVGPLSLSDERLPALAGSGLGLASTMDDFVTVACKLNVNHVQEGGVQVHARGEGSVEAADFPIGMVVPLWQFNDTWDEDTPLGREALVQSRGRGGGLCPQRSEPSVSISAISGPYQVYEFQAPMLSRELS